MTIRIEPRAWRSADMISAESLDAIDAALWADLTTFLAASDRGIVRAETHEPA